MTIQSASLQKESLRERGFRELFLERLGSLFPNRPRPVLTRALRGRALIGVFLADDGIHLNLLILINGRRRAAWRIHLETLEYIVEEPRPDETWLIFHQTRMKIARLHLEKDLFSLESAGNTPLFVYARRSRKGFWHLYFS